MFTRTRILFAAALLVSGFAVAALANRGPPPRRLVQVVDARSHASVKPQELAAWMVEGRRDFTVVDLREPAAFQAGRVRGAVSCSHCHDSAAEGRAAVEKGDFVDLTKKLVVYTETGQESVELPRALARNPRLMLLEGGYRGWKDEVLGTVSFEGVTDADRLEALGRREAVRAFFSGERPSAAPASPLPVAPVKRQGAHKPATAREGC